MTRPNLRPRPRPNPRPNQAGFALLIVLWSLALTALIVTAMAATGRSEARLAANLRDAAIVREAVDGAVQEATFNLATGKWTLGAAPHLVVVGTTRVEVVVDDEAGKVNPNDTSLPMLRALLVELGVPAPQAGALAVAILDYSTVDEHPPPGHAAAPQYLAAGRNYGPSGHPFFSVRELGVVLGMTPDILARLTPYVSVYKATGFDLAKAAPPVRRAFAAAGPNGGYGTGQFDLDGPATLHIAARSVSPGAAASRSVVVRVAMTNGAAVGSYALMDWE